MTASSSDRVSPRAAKFWAKLSSWYGHSIIQQNYGEVPPRDWIDLIGTHSDANIRLALAEVRTEHTKFPPTLPQLEQILRKVSGPKIIARGPRPQDTLTEHVLRHVKLTPRQLQTPWTFFGREFAAKNSRGELVEGHGREVVGVAIDPDGDTPGYRILLADIEQQAHEFADAMSSTAPPPEHHFAEALPQLPEFGQGETR